ncbi:MAG TPA: hypothetical protein VJQ55_00600, partial [Candidatus Binatia bacterium]|nr:hypothetical protein [Candidatus Binatia bacterium]
MAHFQRSPITPLVFLVMLTVLSAAAPNRELEGLKKKIETEKKDLGRLERKESSVAESLGKIQGELDRRSQEIKTGVAKLSSINGELKLKEAEAERLAGSSSLRFEMLQRRAAALYRWTRSGSAMMLLNGTLSPSSVMQRQHYLAAALSHDRELLAQLEEERRLQAGLQGELERKRKELAEQQSALARANEAIRQEATKKQLLLTSLRRERSTRLRALEKMQAAAQRLEKMMEEIARRALVKPREQPTAPMPG